MSAHKALPLRWLRKLFAPDARINGGRRAMIFYGEYAPEGMNAVVYSFLYQATYLGLEALITVIVINIPAVKNALKKLKTQVQ